MDGGIGGGKQRERRREEGGEGRNAEGREER